MSKPLSPSLSDAKAIRLPSGDIEGRSDTGVVGQTMKLEWARSFRPTSDEKYGGDNSHQSDDSERNDQTELDWSPPG